MCARLANTDGAVVFDDTLHPLAFGCKFVVAEKNFSFGPEMGDYLRSRGLRHRSAAGLVANTPGCVAIVVSQDGATTMFSRNDAQVAHRPLCL